MDKKIAGFSYKNIFRKKNYYVLFFVLPLMTQCVQREQEVPNIIFAISDDQSWPHAGAYGCDFLKTPVFDRLANEGILFLNAFASAPQCSPARASLLTSRNIWQLEEAGVHGSFFPKKFPVFTHLLEEHGYHVGYTGKGWGPGLWNAGGEGVARDRDPVGKAYNEFTLQPPYKGISPNDYSANFTDFLEKRNPDQPFFFWFGCWEPHRPYQAHFGVNLENGLDGVEVPAFMPNNETVKEDLLNYAVEIEWFDLQLGKMIQKLKEIGEFENTIIIVTADNGMAFPRAKMQNYEHGIHVPMAMRWGKSCKGNRKVDDPVGFIDLAPTFLEAAGISIPQSMSGRSLMNIIKSKKSGQVEEDRTSVLTGKERHSCARAENLCYPIRAIRTNEYLYIRNLKPDRWPGGDPPYYLDMFWWFVYDWPSASYIVKNKDNPEISLFFDINVAKRPLEELYDIKNDPGCFNNLAGKQEYKTLSESLWNELKEKIIQQKDPRMFGKGDCFDSSPMTFLHNINRTTKEKLFSGIVPQGEYNTNMMIFDHSGDEFEAIELMNPKKHE